MKAVYNHSEGVKAAGNHSEGVKAAGNHSEGVKPVAYSESGESLFYRREKRKKKRCTGRESNPSPKVKL